MSERVRQLVLIGGGHTHALLVKQLVEEPLANTKVTLVSDVEKAPYSGMLPGHVAGFYSHDEMHIDLPRVCARAGVEFVLGKVIGIDPANREIELDSGEVMGVRPDVLSINVGSHPKVSAVPGASEFAIPSKPVPELLEGWAKMRKQVADQTVAVVGGGAGGVELTLAMQAELPEGTRFVLVHAGERLLEGHAGRVARILTGVLRERGVEIRLGERVGEVREDALLLESGETVPADFVFWVTQPAAPGWLRNTGLDLTEKGFVRVRATLQATGFDWIFAAGDVATIEGESLPKSGVYAVRMAVPLERNLRALLVGERLSDYDPQQVTLALIGTADGKAVASYGPLAWHSAGMWRWKDRIDRKFMRQFVVGEELREKS